MIKFMISLDKLPIPDGLVVHIIDSPVSENDQLIYGLLKRYFQNRTYRSRAADLPANYILCPRCKEVLKNRYAIKYNIPEWRTTQ